MLKKTKIVATMGPSTMNKEVLKKMMLNGLNVCRLNFSHGSYEDHKNSISLIKELNKELDLQVSILGDLQGPKLRIGTFEKEKVELTKGQTFILDLESSSGNRNRVNFPHKDIYEILEKNNIF